MKGSILADFHYKEFKLLEQVEMVSLKESGQKLEFVKAQLCEMLLEGVPAVEGELIHSLVAPLMSIVSREVIINLLLSEELMTRADLNVHSWRAVVNQMLFSTRDFCSDELVVNLSIDCNRLKKFLLSWVKNCAFDLLEEGWEELFSHRNWFMNRAYKMESEWVTTNNERKELKNPEILSIFLKVISEVVGEGITENVNPGAKVCKSFKFALEVFTRLWPTSLCAVFDMRGQMTDNSHWDSNLFIFSKDFESVFLGLVLQIWLLWEQLERPSLMLCDLKLIPLLIRKTTVKQPAIACAAVGVLKELVDSSWIEELMEIEQKEIFYIKIVVQLERMKKTIIFG
eukprot:TRINITY_DN1408_c0_g1_i1.p1 TRINITY_DN1408_c0_g1~~TRINITY_DN1408_c0_g1_i1.p1  ORF type:complete len:342 (+),score=42.17 TRINITY_DN1408_c0_g1_i1:431-1456(+)